jgi:hypothetical protein
MSFFRNLFTPGDDKPQADDTAIPPEEDAVLEKLAKKVVDWKMTVPAIMFLESVKPLNYIGSQALVFFEPIVQSIFSFKDYDTFRIAMERRENVENLIRKIEALDAVAYKKEKLYKKKVKEARKSWTWYQKYLGIRQPKIEIDPSELEDTESESGRQGSSDNSRSHK